MPEWDTIDVLWSDWFSEYELPGNGLGRPSTDAVAITESHPDSPARVINIRESLTEHLESDLQWHTVSAAEKSELSRVHTTEHLKNMYQALDDETFKAAVHAVQAAIQASIKSVAEGRPTYAPVRPSGHHALASTTAGFCVFNNTAIAASHLLETTDTKRVCILDWDIHHGNGTQEIFYDRDDVLFVSIHEQSRNWGLPPSDTEGAVAEVGTGDGTGYNINIPLPPGVGDRGYELIFEHIVESVLEDYRPDAFLISAGQDCGIVDKFGRNLVTASGFRRLGELVGSYANQYTASGPILIQEGGYQPTHLALSTRAIFDGILESDNPVPATWKNVTGNTSLAKAAIDTVVETHSDYWSLTPV